MLLSSVHCIIFVSIFPLKLVSGIGARELWGTLRNNSQIKLERQDDMIPADVKVHVQKDETKQM